MISEVTIAFVPVKGMHEDFVSLSIDTGQARVDHWAIAVRRGGSFPLGGKSEAGAREVFVGAHHSAP